MSDHQIPSIFEPVFDYEDRYIAIRGGRGSGKSTAIADLIIFKCLEKKTRGLCAREFQNSIELSSKSLIEERINHYGVQDYFRVTRDFIETPHDGVLAFKGLQDHGIDKIRGYQDFDFMWLEEARNMRQKTLEVIRPTFRKNGSQLIFTWNSELPEDPIERFFVDTPPPNALVLKANYYDNPFFPDVLESERLVDKANNPNYAHIWEGDYRRPDGSEFFTEQSLLIDGLPSPLPPVVDYFMAIVDTAVKTQKDNDSTAVTYFAVQSRIKPRLIVLDYDIVKIEGAFLENWMPSVFDRIEQLANTIKSRKGGQVWIPDTDAGALLLQKARHLQHKHGWSMVNAIPSEFIAMGKSAGAIDASTEIYAGQVKFSEYAYNKVVKHKESTKNHLLSQIINFRVGVDNKDDDLFDTFRTGVQLAKPQS